jgi:CHAD domain-containing protein
MKHITDGCGKKVHVPLKDIDCEECLETLHKKATEAFSAAYEYLCDVKLQRYEAAFKAATKEQPASDQSDTG